MKYSSTKRITAVGIVFIACFFALLLMTNPVKLPVLAILAVPFTLFFGLSSIFYAISSRTTKPWSRRLFYAVILGGLPVFVLLLQSVNQLTPKDIALALVLVILSSFYVGRMRLRANTKR